MIRAYYGREPLPAETGRMVIYKAMCDLLWTLWGLIQSHGGDPEVSDRAALERRFVFPQAIEPLF